MKNGLSDLNNMLFEQLDRLSDDELNLETELKRSKAMAGIAESIIQIAEVQLDALKLMDNSSIEIQDMPALLIPKDAKNNKKLIGVKNAI